MTTPSSPEAPQQPTPVKRYTKAQTWGALKKAWKGYRIAKAGNDTARMKEYANRIRTLQRELGLPQSNFTGL